MVDGKAKPRNFDFVETIGKDFRQILEEDPKFKKIYQGADPIRKGKEFIDNVKELIDLSKKEG